MYKLTSMHSTNYIYCINQHMKIKNQYTIKSVPTIKAIQIKFRYLLTTILLT